jgi:hypothetical protein
VGLGGFGAEADGYDGAAPFGAAVGDVRYALAGGGVGGCEVETDVVEVGVGGGGGK